jgi:hypothetical protein
MLPLRRVGFLHQTGNAIPRGNVCGVSLTDGHEASGVLKGFNAYLNRKIELAWGSGTF